MSPGVVLTGGDPRRTIAKIANRPAQTEKVAGMVNGRRPDR